MARKPQPTDIADTSIRLPVAIAIVFTLVTSGLGYWVHANDQETAQANQTANDNAKAIAELAKQQAVYQQNVSTIVELLKQTQADAKATHDTVIRLEERSREAQQQRDSSSHR